MTRTPIPVNQVTFELSSWPTRGVDDSPIAVLTPHVDGVSLIGIVADYERNLGNEFAGDYAGLIPRHFNYGDMAEYLLGRTPGQWPEPHVAALLGCSCGEVGCGPLFARVTMSETAVSWSFSGQRRDIDHSKFGPFLFDATQYEEAAYAVRDRLAALPPAYDEMP
ncbi:hypothetical protein ABLE92_11845 [Gordonia sp. VNQ95]|uniref:hypothetical protein n=1 Tax=Gordonia sp. VNQ95 TaxID=3156619 RepID=UPI0032B5BA53